MNTIVEPSILRGDARALLLADDSVDLVLTSPPYFGLRSYRDGGRHYAGQLGAEATSGEEWPRRLILGWSPYAVCTRCGQGRRRVPVGSGLDLTRPQTCCAVEFAERAGLSPCHVDALRSVGLADTRRGAAIQTGAGNNAADTILLAAHARRVLGGYVREFLHHPTDYTDACDCPDTTAPTRPAVVLDPFGGTGTTALVASVHGRHGISVDAGADYCRLATWRAHDPRQRARALGDRPGGRGLARNDRTEDRPQPERRRAA